MELKLAQPQHLDALCRITEDAKAQLKALGVNQWQNGYPNRVVWQQDIQAQTAWLAVEDGKILGAFVFQTEPEPSYDPIDGAWLSSGAYATMHRVCVAQAYKGQGVAGALFRYGMALAKERQLPALRIDTHQDNQPMQRALEKAGFTLCGVITLKDGVEDGQPRLAFEIMLGDCIYE